MIQNQRFRLSCHNDALTAEQRGGIINILGMNKLFLIPCKPRDSSPRRNTRAHARAHTLFWCGVGKEAGIVSKPIITIHSKDDLPRPSPSSYPLGEVWFGCPLSQPPADEIPRTRRWRCWGGWRVGGSPGTVCAATSAALTCSGTGKSLWASH